MKKNAFPGIFSPFSVKGISFKNRIIRSAMYTGLADESGGVTDRLLARYARLARGGVSCVLVEAAGVNKNSRASPVQLMIDSNNCLSGLSKLASTIKKYGAIPGIQLFHAGRYALMANEILSSSGVPLEIIPGTYFYSRAMRKEEIEETINDFCVAVIRAMESGFEIVEVHGAGGYLISDFLSPRSNKRLDEYGLTIEGRMKFALDLMTAIKKTAKGRVLCGFRLMVDELVPGGVTFEDAVILAEALIKNSLVDYLNPLPGTHEAYINDQVAERLKEPGFGLNYSRVLKNLFPYAVVFGNWGIDTPEIAESAINARECDAVALARPLLADPDFPLKSREGREREIVRCQACYNCYYLALRGAEVKCKQWERKK